nr:hypothetical protein [Deltaproteobacteria bacterium]
GGQGSVLPARGEEGRHREVEPEGEVVQGVVLAVLSAVRLDPAIETVILLQAFMPAAIYSVVASVLFDLDGPLASNMFVWNTLLFLAGVLPVLLVFRDVLGGLIR